MSVAVANALAARLLERNREVAVAQQYADGEYRLAFLSPKMREAFGSVFAAAGLDLADLIVRAASERLQVDGFDSGDRSLDEAAWNAWVASGLDSLFEAAMRQAMVTGQSYLAADPNGGGPGVPTLHVEDAFTTYVEVNPATREREYALRLWQGEDGHAVALLYTGDEVQSFRSERKVSAETSDIKLRAIGREPNPLGVVPFVPIVNSPDARDRCGRSDLLPVIPLIDVAHYYAGNMLVTAEFSAFPQRVLTGVEIPRDPETNEPLPAQQIATAQSRLWTFEAADARVTSLPTADLSGYLRAIEQQVRLIAAVTRTPAHYLMSQFINVSAEALVASEAGFIGKLEAKAASYSKGVREAMQIALQTDAQINPTWRPFERFSPSIVADAASKEMAVGVAAEEIWRKRLSYDPRTVARMSEEFRGALARRAQS
jgi:Phage portal protein, SPP1 Gp6-like